MCISLQECEAMIRAVEQTGKLLAVDQVLRFFPYYQSIKEHLADGGLGEIYYAEADYLHNTARLIRERTVWRGFNRTLPLPDPWRRFPLLDMLRLLVGEVDRVHCEAAQRALPDFPFPDCMIATLHFANGAVGKCTTSYGLVRSTMHNLVLFGTNGTIERARGGHDRDKHFRTSEGHAFSEEAWPVPVSTTRRQTDSRRRRSHVPVRCKQPDSSHQCVGRRKHGGRALARSNPGRLAGRCSLPSLGRHDIHCRSSLRQLHVCHVAAHGAGQTIPLSHRRDNKLCNSVSLCGWLGGVERNPSLDPVVIILGAITDFSTRSVWFVLFTVVELVGIGITFGIIRLSVALPTLASIFLWGEQPAVLQVVGLALAFVALPLFGRGRAPGNPQQPWALVSDMGSAAGALLLSGAGLTAAKAFSVWSTPDYQPLYTASVFVAATLGSAFVCLFASAFVCRTGGPPRCGIMSAWE